MPDEILRSVYLATLVRWWRCEGSLMPHAMVSGYLLGCGSPLTAEDLADLAHEVPALDAVECGPFDMDEFLAWRDARPQLHIHHNEIASLFVADYHGPTFDPRRVATLQFRLYEVCLYLHGCVVRPDVAHRLEAIGVPRFGAGGAAGENKLMALLQRWRRSRPESN